MRKSMIAAAAALAVAALPALAQTSAPGSAPRSPAGATTAAPRPPMPNPLTQEDLSRVKGTDVYGTDDKKIGSIDTVLMNPQSKSVDRLVVRAGGVLGVGGHNVAIPVDQFTWDMSHEGFKLTKTSDELKSMPEWKAASAGSSSSFGSSGATSSTGAGSGTPVAPINNTATPSNGAGAH
jgi:sporulation protein YlmC with PRC-barrel domain